MKYILEIKPAILPEERHKIEKFLESEGYDVSGGGTDIDLSSCEISFSNETGHKVITESVEQPEIDFCQTCGTAIG